MPEKSSKPEKSSPRPWVNDEGFLLCRHCGKLDSDHYDLVELPNGEWIEKTDESGSVYRKRCQAAIENQLQGYYSEKIKQCKIVGPVSTDLSKFITLTESKDVGLPISNALIYADLPVFQAHFKTFLRDMFTGRPKLKFSYIDTVHIPRLRDIKFGKDPEFKTFDEMDKYDMLIIDLGITSYENVTDSPNVMELMSIRRYSSTWFISHVDNRHKLSRNLSVDVQDEIRKYSIVNLSGGAITAPKPVRLKEEPEEMSDDVSLPVKEIDKMSYDEVASEMRKLDAKAQKASVASNLKNR